MLVALLIFQTVVMLPHLTSQSVAVLGAGQSIVPDKLGGVHNT
jgi:hypothetical protein